jgi:hypothetical protein
MEDFWEMETFELFLSLNSKFFYHDNQPISEGCGSLPAIFWQVEKTRTTAEGYGLDPIRRNKKPLAILATLCDSSWHSYRLPYRN